MWRRVLAFLSSLWCRDSANVRIPPVLLRLSTPRETFVPTNARSLYRAGPYQLDTFMHKVGVAVARSRRAAHPRPERPCATADSLSSAPPHICSTLVTSYRRFALPFFSVVAFFGNGHPDLFCLPSPSPPLSNTQLPTSRWAPQTTTSSPSRSSRTFSRSEGLRARAASRRATSCAVARRAKRKWSCRC